MFRNSVRLCLVALALGGSTFVAACGGEDPTSAGDDGESPWIVKIDVPEATLTGPLPTSEASGSAPTYELKLERLPPTSFALSGDSDQKTGKVSLIRFFAKWNDGGDFHKVPAKAVLQVLDSASLDADLSAIVIESVAVTSQSSVTLTIHQGSPEDHGIALTGRDHDPLGDFSPAPKALSVSVTSPSLFAPAQAGDQCVGHTMSTDDAKSTCPGVCEAVGLVWGHRWTNDAEGSSCSPPTVCGCDDPPNQYKPIFAMHGIGDVAASFNPIGDRIKALHVGTRFITIPLYEGKGIFNSSWTPGSMKQVTVIRQWIEDYINADSRKSDFDNGYHIIGHSQGALFSRGIISIWDDHNFDTYISLAGPQQGVQGYGWVAPNWLVDYYTSKDMYNRPIQHQFTPAGYWKDMTRYGDDGFMASGYQNYSTFLAVINNEAPERSVQDKCSWWFTGCRPDGCSYKFQAGQCQWDGDNRFNKNPRMQDNFKRLGFALFFGSPDDDAIVPPESTLWGYYKMGSNKEVVPYAETILATKDLVPLELMMTRFYAKIISKPNMKHKDWLKPEFVELYIDYLH